MFRLVGSGNPGMANLLSIVEKQERLHVFMQVLVLYVAIISLYGIVLRVEKAF